MKRILVCLTALILTACMLTSCTAVDTKQTNSPKLSFVCTIFPEYDWVREIIGDHADGVDLTLLLDSGVDLHSYQPTADDILKISGCDVFLYVGGESDGWVQDALKEAVNQDMIVINLLDALGDTVKEEEVVEGMQADDEHDHADAGHEDHAHEEAQEEGPEYDEHVWLSLKNAKTLVAYIAQMLGQADSVNVAAYEANANDYIEKLVSLDNEYHNTADSAATKTVLFGDRFPFRYLVDDYGLNYYAAFVGCSAETEASFETVVFLAEKMDALKLKHVLVIDSSDQSIAKTIINNTTNKDQQILPLDSMQSVTADDVAEGVTYLSIMQSNLEVLKTALN